MPWEDKTVEKNRTEFVLEAIEKEKNFSQLCREYGITRRIGYKWVERFKSGEGLGDKSHARFKTPNKTATIKEELILQAREMHQEWGARKLKRYLEDKGHQELPATSTISDILKRNNCIKPEESIKHKAYIRFEREKANELWQTDFKGDFLMQNNKRCYPLTVLDDHSRYSLCIEAKSNQQGIGVMESFKRLFKEYGMPNAILSDNGAPWGNSRNGYTQFELWLMQLNILPIHGRPMHPQTQGKEERFHRTLKYEILKRNAYRDMENAQESFDNWRYEYNNERPHEALKLDVPARHYKESELKMPEEIKEPEYNEGCRIKKVTNKGVVNINKHKYFISEIFTGKYLELLSSEEDTLKLCYGDFVISTIDLSEQQTISKKIYRR